MEKKTKLILAIWIIFWIFFLIRGLYKGEFDTYKTLLSRDVEGRRAYVYGEEFYSFLDFSADSLYEGATFNISGDFKPIDRYRLIYYLYPHRLSQRPDFILCYKVKKAYAREGFDRFVTFDDDKFILMRRR